MIYLDNAATTYPKPPAVINAVRQALQQYGANPGRSGHDMAMATSDQIYRCREKAAAFFHNGEPEHVAFTMNCTQSLNMAIKGLVARGDHVLTSCLEHNAVMRPLYALARDGVITYSTARVYPEEPDKTLQSFASELRPHTRLIVCMHASNVFGTVLPIEQIGALAQKHGIRFLVDAAQSAGMLPIDMERMHIDCLCMPGHKGLYGPMGTGLLLTKGELPMRTILEGGTGSMSAQLEQPDIFPDRLESGTGNAPGIIGLSSGFDFLTQRGTQTIYSHEMRLIQQAYHALSGIPKVRLYTDLPQAGFFAPVLSFNVDHLYSEEVATRLNEYGIAVRAGLHCAPAAHEAAGTKETGTIRICPSAFTKEMEINYFIKCVRKIANDA